MVKLLTKGNTENWSVQWLFQTGTSLGRTYQSIYSCLCKYLPVRPYNSLPMTFKGTVENAWLRWQQTQSVNKTAITGWEDWDSLLQYFICWVANSLKQISSVLITLPNHHLFPSQTPSNLKHPPIPPDTVSIRFWYRNGQLVSRMLGGLCNNSSLGHDRTSCWMLWICKACLAGQNSGSGRRMAPLGGNECCLFLSTLHSKYLPLTMSEKYFRAQEQEFWLKRIWNPILEKKY